MIIIFLGPPGAGKGTQTQLLSKKLKIPAISVGQLLRENAKEAWEKYSRRGLNIPTQLKFRILAPQLEKAKSGYILDNFPRTRDDLLAFQKYLEEKKVKVDRVFHLKVSDEVVVERILGRRGIGNKETGQARDDDDLAILKTRIEEGYRKDLPLISDYFRSLGVLEEISDEGSGEAIHGEVLRRLGLDD